MHQDSRRELSGGGPGDATAAALCSLTAGRFIVSMVAGMFALSPADLLAPTRGIARIAHARQFAMYLGHVACGIPLREVAACFGRDRTTVGYACRVVEDRRDNPAIDRSLDHLERALRTWTTVSLEREER